MKKTIRIIAVTAIASLSYANGALIQIFQIDSGNGTIAPANTLVVSLSGLDADGVTFDATLTVTGSGDLDQGGGGIGVAGNSSALVNSGEFLTFSITTSNVSGGTIVFDGFTEIDFNNFGTGDDGVLSLDSSEGTTGDNFVVFDNGAGNVDISGTSPTSFSAIALSAASNSFRVDDISASFTGTVVPEPSSFALLGLAGLGTLLRRRR